MTRNSQTPIIDTATYQKFLERRELNKKYRAHNLKREHLCAGRCRKAGEGVRKLND